MKAQQLFEKDENIHINKTIYIADLKQAERFGTFLHNVKTVVTEFQKHGAGYYDVIQQRPREDGFDVSIFEFKFIGEIEDVDTFLNKLRFIKDEFDYVSRPYRIWEIVKKNPHSNLSLAERKELEHFDEAEVFLYLKLKNDYCAGHPIVLPPRKMRKKEIERLENQKVDLDQLASDGFVIEKKSKNDPFAN